MYGYGYRYSVRPNVLAFNPLTDIDGLSLYLNKNTNVNTKIAADFVSANSEYLSSSSTDFDKGNESFSYGGWFKRSLATEQTIGGQFGGSLPSNRSWMLQVNSANDLYSYISDGTTLTLTPAIGSIDANWNFAVFVYDAVNDLVKCSLNGASFVTASQSNGANTTFGGDFEIGRRNGTTYSTGQVDSTFFYDKALSLAEVQALYNSGNGTSYPDLEASQLTDLVSWWDLNEESGTRTDAHGTNNLTDNNTVGYALGKVQDETVIGERVWNWIDQSTNAYIFKQDTVTKQPTLSANSNDFDGTDDGLTKTIADALNDTSGIIFFSGYFDNSANNFIFSTADQSIDSNYWVAEIQGATGKLRINSGDGTTANVITSTNVIANGSYFYGYMKSTGTAYEINLNGNIETLIVVTGSNDGMFIGDVSGRDSLTVGWLDRLSPIYTPVKVNKIIYSNDHTIDTTPILNFLSNPDN